MLLGHLPAGYLAGEGARAAGAGAWLFAGVLAGSVLPDVDMLRFLLVDRGAVHHHAYPTHRPALWAAVLAAGLLLRRGLVAGVGLGGLLHMALDTIAGAVAWGWPLVATPVTLVDIPATRGNWVLSFLFHWTFAVEIGVTLAAIVVFAWRCRGAGRCPP